MNKKALIVSLVLVAMLTSPLVGTVVASPYTNIDVATAHDMITSGSYPDLVVLDVRRQDEYDSGHIYGAVWIPHTELEARIDELAGHENHEIVVHCRSGARSVIASGILDSNGFTKVFNMLGGILAWLDAGYPVWIATVHNADTTFSYDTVQAAINAPQTLDGHTILVDSGTYTENVDVTKSLKIKSINGPSMTSIHGKGGYVLTVMAHNVNINGFEISNGSKGIFCAFRNVTIANNRIVNMSCGIEFYHGYGTLDGNTIENCVKGVILWSFASTQPCYVLDNLFKDNGLAVQAWGDCIAYHNNFVGNTIHVDGSSKNVCVWDGGYPVGGNYLSDYADVDSYCGPGQNILGSDGIWDHPYVIDSNNTDYYPLVKPYVPGNLSVSVYTDKYSYQAGDIMQLGLNASNPDSVKYLCFAIWVTLPDNSIYLYMHEHSVILPIGLHYANPSFQVITLPNLPPGKYTWHTALLERATHTIIVEDTAEFQFS